MTTAERKYTGMEEVLFKVRDAMHLLREARRGSEDCLHELDTGIGLLFNTIDEPLRDLEYGINSKVLELHEKWLNELGLVPKGTAKKEV